MLALLSVAERGRLRGTHMSCACGDTTNFNTSLRKNTNLPSFPSWGNVCTRARVCMHM